MRLSPRDFFHAIRAYGPHAAHCSNAVLATTPSQPRHFRIAGILFLGVGILWLVLGLSAVALFFLGAPIKTVVEISEVRLRVRRAFAAGERARVHTRADDVDRQHQPVGVLAHVRRGRAADEFRGVEEARASTLRRRRARGGCDCGADAGARAGGGSRRWPVDARAPSAPGLRSTPRGRSPLVRSQGRPRLQEPQGGVGWPPRRPIAIGRPATGATGSRRRFARAAANRAGTRGASSRALQADGRACRSWRQPCRPDRQGGRRRGGGPYRATDRAGSPVIVKGLGVEELFHGKARGPLQRGSANRRPASSVSSWARS